jgi:hypothetical protein
MPLITVSAAFFFATRHFVDLLNLLTVFRKEIDSQGRLIEMAMATCTLLLVGYQLCMVLYMHYNNF